VESQPDLSTSVSFRDGASLHNMPNGAAATAVSNIKSSTEAAKSSIFRPLTLL
jgi:hypothetical protein